MASASTVADVCTICGALYDVELESLHIDWHADLKRFNAMAAYADMMCRPLA